MNIFFENRKFKKVLRSTAAAAMFTVAACSSSFAESAKNDDGANAKTRKSNTKIESNTADMDLKNGVAVFKGDVVLVDQDMTVTSEQLTAFLDDNNKLKSMEARGNVVITQKGSDKKATGGYAHYDVLTRKVVLKEKPKLMMGENVLDNAAIITYYLDSERITTEGSVTPGTRTTIVMPSDDEDDDKQSIMDQDK